MSIDLGYIPSPFVIHLAPDGDADFTQTLSTLDGSDWPAGITVALKLGSVETPVADWTSWPATVDGPTISWNVDKAVVVALGPKTSLRAKIAYTDGASADVTWMSGSVRWDA